MEEKRPNELTDQALDGAATPTPELNGLTPFVVM